MFGVPKGFTSQESWVLHPGAIGRLGRGRECLVPVCFHGKASSLWGRWAGGPRGEFFRRLIVERILLNGN